MSSRKSGLLGATFLTLTGATLLVFASSASAQTYGNSASPTFNIGATSLTSQSGVGNVTASGTMSSANISGGNYGSISIAGVGASASNSASTIPASRKPRPTDSTGRRT